MVLPSSVRSKQREIFLKVVDFLAFENDIQRAAYVTIFWRNATSLSCCNVWIYKINYILFINWIYTVL